MACGSSREQLKTKQKNIVIWNQTKIRKVLRPKNDAYCRKILFVRIKTKNNAKGDENVDMEFNQIQLQGENQ